MKRRGELLGLAILWELGQMEKKGSRAVGWGFTLNERQTEECWLGVQRRGHR